MKEKKKKTERKMIKIKTIFLLNLKYQKNLQIHPHHLNLNHPHHHHLLLHQKNPKNQINKIKNLLLNNWKFQLIASKQVKIVLKIILNHPQKFNPKQHPFKITNKYRYKGNLVDLVFFLVTILFYKIKMKPIIISHKISNM